jgi:hypothetical protein
MGRKNQCKGLIRLTPNSGTDNHRMFTAQYRAARFQGKISRREFSEKTENRENFPRKPKILILGGVRFFYLSPEIFGPFESPPKPNWFSQISGHPAAS